MRRVRSPEPGRGARVPASVAFPSEGRDRDEQGPGFRRATVAMPGSYLGSLSGPKIVHVGPGGSSAESMKLDYGGP